MSKKRIKKIQDYDSMYSTLFHYVRFSVKQSYRSILQVGEENIPKDYTLIRDNRVNHVCPADYTEGSEMDVVVKTIIDKIAMDSRLEQLEVAK